jgi:hypothetical protein
MAKYILILLIFASCGKRITSKQHYEFESDTLSVENSVKIEQNTTWNDIVMLKPFDVLKPIKINGKEYHNVIVTIDKSKKTENKKKQVKKENKGTKKEIAKNSNSEKTDYSNIWIGISFVIGLFFTLYMIVKLKKPL